LPGWTSVLGPAGIKAWNPSWPMSDPIAVCLRCHLAHEHMNDWMIYLYICMQWYIYIIFIYNYIYIMHVHIYLWEYIYIYLVQARCNTWRVWVESKVPVALMPTLRSSWSSSSHSKLSQMRTSSWSCSSGAKGNTWGILGTHGKKIVYYSTQHVMPTHVQPAPLFQEGPDAASSRL
jgi:hypothetical protein